MAFELKEIAANVLIAKISSDPNYAQKTTEEIARDYQLIFNQIYYCENEAKESPMAQKRRLGA